MITVKTDFPIAIDSVDHKYPEGVFWDNNIDMNFVIDVENFFNDEKINFADLGCAGGQLSVTMSERGHKSIGLEGSSHVHDLDEFLIQKKGFIPLGHENWEKYKDKVLFNCDLSKDYTIYEDDNIMQFDLITCWDVMEHFNPEDVDNVIYNIQKHVKPNRLFIASIAKWDALLDVEYDNVTVNYHKSVFSDDWWIEKFSKYYIDYNL